MFNPPNPSNEDYKNLWEETKTNLLHLTNLNNTILDSIAEAIIVTDLNYIIVNVNNAVVKLFGFVKEKLLGKSLFDILNFPSQSALQAIASKVKERSISSSIDHVYHHPINGELHLETDIIPLIEMKRIKGLIWVSDDISESKRIEEALRNSENLYRILIENVQDVIWTMDLNLNYTFISPSITRLRGYTVAEVMNQSLDEILTKTSADIARKALQEELKSEESDNVELNRTRTLELEQICKDGSTVWTEVKMTFLRDPQNQPIGILGVTRDLTDRKKVENLRDALVRTKEYLELRKSLDEKLAGEIGLVVIYAGSAGPNNIYNNSNLSEQETFNLTYRGFTVLMSGIDYRNQNITRYVGNVEIPNSKFFGLGFYRTIEGFPSDIKQDPRSKSTVIMIMLVMRKKIMAFMLQRFLQIEEFLAEVTKSWNQLIDLTETEFITFHKKLRSFMLNITEKQQDDLFDQLAEEIIDASGSLSTTDYAMPDDIIGANINHR